MEYRKLRNGKEISSLGLGSGFLRDAGDDVYAIVTKAMEAGVNFMETSMYDDSCAPAIRKAVKDHGDDMTFLLQAGLHFPDGQYSATRDPEECRESFETELRKYGLDHADLLLFHCVDETSDYQNIMSSGLYDMLIGWKEEGRVDNIGISSHTPAICQRAIAETEVDDIMFSLNPAYDLIAGEDGLVINPERESLYAECERNGIGIVAMKPYGGGILMDPKTSPYGRAMSAPQCIQYALDRPAVVSTIPGVGSLAQLDAALAYLDSAPEERDYSFISELRPADMSDQCVYCNHCLPCPANIDIGKVNKFADLFRASDAMAKEHYLAMSRHASDCIHCGRCTSRCPFHLDAVGHVANAKALFGFR